MFKALNCIFRAKLGSQSCFSVACARHTCEGALVLKQFSSHSFAHSGHVRALGSSIRLKQKFGAGYQLSISVMSAKASQQDLTRLAAKADAVKALMRQQLGGLEPVDETKAYVSYVVTQDREQALIELLHRLEDNRQELGITDVQVGGMVGWKLIGCVAGDWMEMPGACGHKLWGLVMFGTQAALVTSHQHCT